MLIFQTPVPVQQTFLQQLEGFLTLFLAGFVPIALTWIGLKLKATSTAQAAHNAASTAKLNAVVANTPGAAAHLAANPPIPPVPGA